VLGRPWKLATIRGVPVLVDPSWVWIAALVTYSLWARFEALHPQVGQVGALAFALLGSFLFFGAVFLHEGAHAVAARSYDIEVQGITLVLFGGFTSARADARGPMPAFVIAAVGPATSLALAGLFWVLSRLSEGSATPMPGLFGYLGWVNLFMAVFNVLPGLPLDGGRMLRALIWRVSGRRETATRVAAWVGMGLGALLFGLAAFELSRGETFQAVWLAIIGSFILQGARASDRYVGIERRLSAGRVADAMEPPPPAIPAELSLSEALDRFLRGHEAETFPVVEGERVIGVISFGSARELGATDPLRPVREATVPLDRVIVVGPQEPLDAVTERLGTERAALVLEDGRLVGLITAGAAYRWALAGR
jgi:Zn-dependent protease